MLSDLALVQSNSLISGMVMYHSQFAVIQRGIKFSVGVDGASRGYICEVFNNHYRLPELGPIGIVPFDRSPYHMIT
jgi:homogentisate 1,2-dioxygenase